MASSSGANRSKRTRGGDVNISIYPVAVRGLTASQRTRYDILSLRKVQSCRYFDNNVIDIMRIHRELVNRLTDMGCISLLNADWRSYKPMVIEFLATFKYREESGDIKFRLGNQTFHLSKSEICDIFNWPEDAEPVPARFEDELWSNMTVGRRESFNVQTSNIAEVPYFAHRYFHRVMTYTLCGRSESNHKVTKTDLEVLYYFHNRRRADLAGILLRRFRSVAERNVGAIGIGGFITAIAIHVANFDPQATNLDFVPGPTTVDSQMAVNMRIIEKGNHGQLRYLAEPRLEPIADSGSDEEGEDEREEREEREGGATREERGEPSNIDMGGQPSTQGFDQQSYPQYGQGFSYEQFDARFTSFEQQVYSRVDNVEREIGHAREDINQTREMLQRQQDQLAAYFSHMGFYPPPPQ